MIKGYSEVTENWGNIAPYVNRGSLVQGIFLSKKCFFYDTCSFRYHANLASVDKGIHNKTTKYGLPTY